MINLVALPCLWVDVFDGTVVFRNEAIAKQPVS